MGSKRINRFFGRQILLNVIIYCKATKRSLWMPKRCGTADSPSFRHFQCSNSSIWLLFLALLISPLPHYHLFTRKRKFNCFEVLTSGITFVGFGSSSSTISLKLSHRDCTVLKFLFSTRHELSYDEPWTFFKANWSYKILLKLIIQMPKDAWRLRFVTCHSRSI